MKVIMNGLLLDDEDMFQQLLTSGAILVVNHKTTENIKLHYKVTQLHGSVNTDQ